MEQLPTGSPAPLPPPLPLPTPAHYTGAMPPPYRGPMPGGVAMSASTPTPTPIAAPIAAPVSIAPPLAAFAPPSADAFAPQARIEAFAPPAHLVAPGATAGVVPPTVSPTAPAIAAPTLPVPPQWSPVPVIPLGGAQPHPLDLNGYPSIPPVTGPAVPFTMTLTTVTARQRIAAVVAVIGAAAISAGTFVPWMRVAVLGAGERSGNGFNNVLGATTWGVPLLVAALIVAVGAAPAIAGVRSPVAMFAVAGSAIALAVGAWQLVDVFGSRPGYEISPGPGIVVLLVGAAVALAAAIVVSRSVRPATVGAPRAVGAVG